LWVFAQAQTTMSQAQIHHEPNKWYVVDDRVKEVSHTKHTGDCKETPPRIATCL
jgi:hypothetical protein